MDSIDKKERIVDELKEIEEMVGKARRIWFNANLSGVTEGQFVSEAILKLHNKKVSYFENRARIDEQRNYVKNSFASEQKYQKERIEYLEKQLKDAKNNDLITAKENE